jgi:lysophospholipid acyltransferase (LPLAT)-like uncharacterized protein
VSVAGAASRAISALLRIESLTWRIECEGRERFDRLSHGREPFVFALWHGRMLVPIWKHRDEGIATMASRSKDGEIIAKWLERNGYVVVRGSTHKGGARGVLRLKALLEEGRPAALTVDGPKGPPRRVQAGLLTLVRRANAWVLPISGSATRPRFLKSWDRYLFPLPFSRNVVVYGAPFRLGRESDEEAAARIESAIDEATARADRLAGVSAPPPWGPASRPPPE